MNDSVEKKRRDLMIRYLDSLVSKNHILCKSTLDKYKFRLELGEKLTSKEFTVIAKFMDRDSRMTKRELRDHFSPIIGKNEKKKSINKRTVEPSSLEEFLL